MTQYFYDLTIAKPGGGEWPVMLRGSKGANSGASILSIGPGVSNASNKRLFNIHKVSGETPHQSLGAGISSADTDVVARLTLSRASSDTFTNIGPAVVFARAGTIGSSGRPADCYYATNGNTVSTGASQRNLVIYKIVSNTQTSLGSASNVITALSGEFERSFVKIRLQCVGTTIRAKMWRDEDSEPGSWQVSVTDSSVSAAGDAGVIVHGYGTKYSLDYLGVGTGADAAPHSLPGGARVVTGRVKDPDGELVGVGYTVRCYHRETGLLLGETTTDADGVYSFSLTIPQTELVYLQAIDSVGNLWGSPTLDRVGVV